MHVWVSGWVGEYLTLADPTSALLIPEVRRQNSTVSESRRKINQMGKLQINLGKKNLGKLRWGDDSIWVLIHQRFIQTHYKITCGAPYDHFMMRVRASVSVAITLVQVPGQPQTQTPSCLCLPGRQVPRSRWERPWFKDRWTEMAHLHTVSCLVMLYVHLSVLGGGELWWSPRLRGLGDLNVEEGKERGRRSLECRRWSKSRSGESSER